MSPDSSSLRRDGGARLDATEGVRSVAYLANVLGHTTDQSTVKQNIKGD